MNTNNYSLVTRDTEKYFSGYKITKTSDESISNVLDLFFDKTILEYDIGEVKDYFKRKKIIEICKDLFSHHECFCAFLEQETLEKFAIAFTGILTNEQMNVCYQIVKLQLAGQGIITPNIPEMISSSFGLFDIGDWAII